jgi:hypothetical protein
MKLEQTSIRTWLTGGELNLNDFAAHFHNPLLLAEPVIVRNQLGEIGILQLSLCSDSGLAGNASSHFKHSHGFVSPNWVNKFEFELSF